MRKRFLITGLLVSGIFYFLFCHRKIRYWGCRKNEPDMEIPGDWLIGDKYQSTRSITVRKGAKDIWPWLSQMYRGAGTYYGDYFFNQNRKSADYLIADITPPQKGDYQPDYGYLVDVKKEKALVWIKKTKGRFSSMVEQRISYYLKPFGENHCRLIIRKSYNWTGWSFIIKLPFVELWDYFFFKGQLLTIKKLVESFDYREKGGYTNQYLAGKHQGKMYHSTDNSDINLINDLLSKKIFPVVDPGYLLISLVLKII